MFHLHCGTLHMSGVICLVGISIKLQAKKIILVLSKEKNTIIYAKLEHLLVDMKFFKVVFGWERNTEENIRDNKGHFTIRVS